jgi:Xaa-Pro aminopeptidase
MVVTNPADVAYLTGFEGQDGVAVVAAGGASLIVNALYGQQAREDCSDLDVRVGQASKQIIDALAGKGVRRLGAQATHMKAATWQRLVEMLGSRKLEPADEVVSNGRLMKDADELRAIRKAVRVAEKAFNVLLTRGKKAFVGRTERQVVAELDYQMCLGGAQEAAFPTIVAAGAGASQPHYQAGSRKIRLGEPVLIDWGARVGGYCSDLTRVVFTDRIPPAIGRVYELVAAAQAAGIKAIKPRVMARTVDRAARDVIVKGGYGEQFMHGVGHGLGLEVHEAPTLAASSKQRLGKGMVVTVEPGIYLPGVGGVRIEDDVVVTAEGRRRLSSLPVDIKKMVLR